MISLLEILTRYMSTSDSTPFTVQRRNWMSKPKHGVAEVMARINGKFPCSPWDKILYKEDKQMWDSWMVSSTRTVAKLVLHNTSSFQVFLGQKTEERCSNIIRNKVLSRWSAVSTICLSFGSYIVMNPIYSGYIYFIPGFLRLVIVLQSNPNVYQWKVIQNWEDGFQWQCKLKSKQNNK